jgi:formate hydrogenlyase subunit 3/multisubunit Na+/H+ antiporter MnhD subunit
MARGRPALATMLMATGIIALAVPGSSAFAGEFLILAGIFSSGWGWALAGATGIVLAAMYMLRLISAVLHQQPGPAVSDAALDLRPAELGILVPLAACLLALSAWPAAISGNALESSSTTPPLRELASRTDYRQTYRELLTDMQRDLRALRPGAYKNVHVFASTPTPAFAPLPTIHEDFGSARITIVVGKSDGARVRVYPNK